MGATSRAKVTVFVARGGEVDDSAAAEGRVKAHGKLKTTTERTALRSIELMGCRNIIVKQMKFSLQTSGDKPISQAANDRRTDCRSF